ncbi:MAG TPA: IPT/TIG domain-containing protein [Candidatus Angelobacter sp.]|nr:IPT/TIG domain-containing protein [Candidatus Angelobacter sp.]
MPVRSDALVGTQTSVNLDPSSTVFLDASGQPYSPLEVSAGTLTIGGTLNITSVVPAGVQVSAGSTIAVLGTGFTSSAQVNVEGANVVTSKFVSSKEIDITLAQTLLLDGVRVRVTTNTERVMYYPYLHTMETGSSANPVISATAPLFSRITYTTATLPWTNSSTAFTGLALQNPTQGSAQITLQLLSSTNQVLQTSSVLLASMNKITEDILDFFPQPPAGATAIHIISSVPIQILGMHGDRSAQTIAPAVVSVP